MTLEYCYCDGNWFSEMLRSWVRPWVSHNPAQKRGRGKGHRQDPGRGNTWATGVHREGRGKAALQVPGHDGIEKRGSRGVRGGGEGAGLERRAGFPSMARLGRIGACPPTFRKSAGSMLQEAPMRPFCAATFPMSDFPHATFPSPHAIRVAVDRSSEHTVGSLGLCSFFKCKECQHSLEWVGYLQFARRLRVCNPHVLYR